MFAYCGNNPVLLHDSAGTRPKAYPLSDSEILGDECDYGMWFAGSLGIDGTSAIAPQTTSIPPVDPVTTAVGSSIIKAAALVGAAAVVGSCLAPAAYPNEDDDNDKRPTYIYRWGDTSPSNLTPRKRDVDLYPITKRGLSFSLVPGPDKNAVTTIEALNATGVVYAVLDGGNHVSVFPIGGTLEDWYKAGTSSIWTTAVKSVVIKWKG